MTTALVDVVGRAPLPACPSEEEEATASGQNKRPVVGDDSEVALTLQRELNGLRQRRSSRKKFAVEPLDVSSIGGYHQPSSLKRHREVTSSSPRAEEREMKLQKKQRVASRPMVYHEDTRLWYRAQVVSRRGDNEVKVSWDGLDDQFAPVWLSCSSERIWKGSMRSKDWKYVSSGGWLPKSKGGSGRKKQQQQSKSGLHPATPPLVSPHNSCSEATMDSVSEDLHSLKSSDLEETAQRISFVDCEATTTTSARRETRGETNNNAAAASGLKVVLPKVVKLENNASSNTKKQHSLKPRSSRSSGSRKQQQQVNNESKSHVRFVKIKEERHDLPIKMLMKKAFATM
jgi:hypothetical protein